VDKGAGKMNKIKLRVIFLVPVAFLAVVAVHAQSNQQLEPKKIEQKAISKITTAPAGIPVKASFQGGRQGYQMVTDVLDGFGGESESDNYRIPVNSGGQPSAGGTSQSTNYRVNAGYVQASLVNRGDANADGVIDASDVVYLLNYLFIHGPDPCPMEAGDATCDGIIDIADVVYLLNYLFIGGPPPDRL
jgi:hypothetical protein